MLTLLKQIKMLLMCLLYLPFLVMFKTPELVMIPPTFLTEKYGTWMVGILRMVQVKLTMSLKHSTYLLFGKDALLRTGLSGEDSTKVYVKEKGSAGVLDPIDQRQSIGFKINSVGFGSTRLEAIVDYVCVPSQVNQV